MEREITREQPRASKLGFDSFLGDVFGLNLLGLKSLWVAIKDPARYADAARDKRWLDKYTPSFRIWFGLMAVLALMRFFANDLVDVSIAYMEQMSLGSFAELEPDGINSKKFMATVMARTLAFYPLGQLPFLAIVAAMFHSFPGKASYVLRLRWTFAVILPSTLFSTMTSLAMPLYSGLLLSPWFMALLTVCVFALDWSTASRGPLLGIEGRRRYGVALGFAVLLFVGSILGFLLLNLGVTFYTAIELGIAAEQAAQAATTS